MTIVLSQAPVISVACAVTSFALGVLAFRLWRQAVERQAPAWVQDAWRELMLFAGWSAAVFGSSELYPRLYIDDWQQRGLRPEALWLGALVASCLYCWRRWREGQRVQEQYQRMPEGAAHADVFPPSWQHARADYQRRQTNGH